MKNKLNHNEATVVEDYHNKTWKDKTVRPTMIEVHLCVSWYTVDEQPSWHPSFNVRKSKELNEILLDKIILDVQNYGREEWEKDMVFSYQSRFMNRKDIPDNLKDKMKKFDMSKWIHFTELLLESKHFNPPAEAKPYKLILGIDPMIKKVTKDSHPSYVKAAINICEKTLDSSASTDKDKSFAKSILKKLQ